MMVVSFQFVLWSTLNTCQAMTGGHLLVLGGIRYTYNFEKSLDGSQKSLHVG